MSQTGIASAIILGALLASGCRPDDQTTATPHAFTPVSFEEMVSRDQHVDELVEYQGEICYNGGWPGMQGDNPDFAIQFQDEQSGRAFFAYTPSGYTRSYALADAGLAAINCTQRSFTVYGRKILNDQGNPELEIGALEFRMGPYDEKQLIEFDQSFRPYP